MSKKDKTIEAKVEGVVAAAAEVSKAFAKRAVPVAGQPAPKLTTWKKHAIARKGLVERLKAAGYESPQTTVDALFGMLEEADLSALGPDAEVMILSKEQVEAVRTSLTAPDADADAKTE